MSYNPPPNQPHTGQPYGQQQPASPWAAPDDHNPATQAEPMMLPVDEAAQMIPAEPRRLNLAWAIPAAVVILGVVFAAGWWGGTVYTRNGGSDTGKTQALADAQAKCDAAKTGTTVADGGRTLTVDGKGEDDLLSGRGLETSGLVCLMDALSIPQAVREHMSQTRALDGRQTDSWAGYTASWSYHPNSGINLIVQVV